MQDCDSLEPQRWRATPLERVVTDP